MRFLCGWRQEDSQGVLAETLVERDGRTHSVFTSGLQGHAHPHTYTCAPPHTLIYTHTGTNALHKPAKAPAKKQAVRETVDVRQLAN